VFPSTPPHVPKVKINEGSLNGRKYEVLGREELIVSLAL